MDLNSNLSAEELVIIPCKKLKLLSEEEKRKVAMKVAIYYQKKGFPFYFLSNEEKKRVITNLWKFDVNKLEVGNNELQQNMLGLNFVNFYHPQMWSVLVGNNKRTSLDIFNDLELFSNAIYKRINLSNTKLQPFNIRKSLKIFGGYSVSNFRPTIAKYIYKKYCPDGGKVLDPCMGYGGRLFAALVSGVNYTGVDPDERQVIGNTYLSQDVVEFFYPYLPIPEIYQGAFEDLDVEFNKYHLVFTSPPYFDKEKYSFDPSQSFVRYPKYEDWVKNFLETLIVNSYNSLKVGGYFVINVAGDRLVSDTISIASDVFQSQMETKWMRLSKLLGKNQDKNKDKFKLEGIYIWKK